MLLEFFYILTGLFSVCAGVYALFDIKNTKRLGSALFWILFGLILILGPHIPSAVVGGALLVMGLLTVTKSVSLGFLAESAQEYRDKKSLLIGNKIFIPALSIGVFAFLLAQLPILKNTAGGGLIGLGIASLLAAGLSLLICKEEAKYIPYESSRILQQMGPAVILPQLLGALGELFDKAEVDNSIAHIMGSIFPEGNHLMGVILYCVSMALFTMIMGNAFAAFTVITLGIGIPFVIGVGGDPIVVGALGMTAGYCGTLMTPMAANFNIVPANILEMQNKNGVILRQIPVGIALLITHIVLMYIFAF